jgi:hypothetical protein
MRLLRVFVCLLRLIDQATWNVKLRHEAEVGFPLRH